MDELELLKKDWKENKSDDFKNYTEQELFAMTKKRSVSIAKWVFIIALLELGFWFLIGYLASSSEDSKHEDIPFGYNFYSFTICFYRFAFVFKF